MLISVEIGLIFGAAVVSIMTSFFPLWTWVAGTFICLILVPLGLYSRESLAQFRQARMRAYSRVLQHFRLQIASEHVVSSHVSDLEQFKALLLHIERCRELVKPFAGPLGSIDMALQQLSDGGSRIQELIQELGYLTRELKTLGIRCPVVYGGKDESDSEFRVRLRIWSMYLTDLVVMIRNDDVVGARLLEPLEPAAQPNPSKSAVQC